MNVEIDKTDRTIEFFFGTSKLEKKMFKYVSKLSIQLKDKVNEVHEAEAELKERMDMMPYELGGKGR